MNKRILYWLGLIPFSLMLLVGIGYMSYEHPIIPLILIPAAAVTLFWWGLANLMDGR